LTTKEENFAVQLLGKVAGKFSLAIFYALARILRLPAIELLIIRWNNGWEVYLTQRPSNDPHFPNEWHVTGGLARLSDNSVLDTLNRVAREVGCP